MLSSLSVLSSSIPKTAWAGEEGRRVSLWVDLYHGEPVAYEEVLEDLAGVRVVYLGECHALERHHDVQEAILRDLEKRGLRLVLGLEQMEHFQQGELDRFNAGKIDFKELARATDWANRWNNYRQYRPILEAAQRAEIPALALNSRSETIRQIAQSGGVAKIDPDRRKDLPRDLQLEDPLYETLLNLQLMVHMSATPERLRPMREAQICRDEMMASALCSFLQSEQGRDRTALVLCGAGHVSYGLGMPSRVRRRLPQLKDRIVVLSQSGDLELSPQEQAMARDIEITHEQLRVINRPVADYLHVRTLRRP